MKTKAELQEDIKKLKRELEIKDKRIEDLDTSRQNTLESCRLLNQEQKKKIEALEEGAKQINDMCNSILIILARQNGGEIRIPKNHLDMTNGIEHELKVENDDYIFTVKGE